MFVEGTPEALAMIKIKYRHEGVAYYASIATKSEDEVSWNWRVDPTVMDHDLGNLMTEKERMTEKYERALREEQDRDKAARKNYQDLKSEKEAEIAKMSQELNDMDEMIATRTASMELDPPVDPAEQTTEQNDWTDLGRRRT